MLSKLVAIFLFTLNFPCFAESSLNLLFHIGLGANGNYEIGGTIENNSPDQALHSAITYITIDHKCNPSDAKVANLGVIKPQNTLDFRIPIEGVLSSYRILSITGWNSIGVPVEAKDKTADNIKKRENDFTKSCRATPGS